MSSDGFTTTFVVFGEVSNGTESVKDVRTELIYSRVGQVPAKGIFYGNEDTSRKLANILLTGKAFFNGLWSSRSASYEIAFRVRGIYFDKFQGRYETDKLCEFDCGELEVETTYHLGDNQTDKIHTLLIRYAIPKRRELILPTFPDDWKKDLPEYKDWLEYETTLGTMKIETRPYSKTIIVESKQGLFTFRESTLSFQFSVENKDTVEVIKEIERIVQDYLRLISFILQCETKYYKQEVSLLNSEGLELKNILRLIWRSEVKPKERPILFEWHTVDELLKELMPKFLIHTNKPDIEETILLFLAAVHSNHPEVCLILMQAAIETIANTIKRVLNLPDTKCEKCKSPLVHIRERILQVVIALKVQIVDVYPSVWADRENDKGKTFPFITYRNHLAHGRRDEIDYKDLPSELYRQQLLLERLIFHWIGFDARKVKYLKLWEGVKSY
jgi:hypothetical protein